MRVERLPSAAVARFTSAVMLSAVCVSLLARLPSALVARTISLLKLSAVCVRRLYSVSP